MTRYDITLRNVEPFIEIHNNNTKGSVESSETTRKSHWFYSHVVLLAMEAGYNGALEWSPSVLHSVYFVRYYFSHLRRQLSSNVSAHMKPSLRKKKKKTNISFLNTTNSNSSSHFPRVNLLNKRHLIKRYFHKKKILFYHTATRSANTDYFDGHKQDSIQFVTVESRANFR